MAESIFSKWVQPHREYDNAQRDLKRETDFMFSGEGPFVLPVYGESGAGKSALFDDYEACYGSIVNESGRPCILRISMPTKQSGKSLPERIFQKLNNNHLPKCGEAAMRDKALKALINAGVKVLLVEEINNLVESKASKRALTNEAVHLSNWFKEIFDTNEISLVLSGLPSIKILFHANPQLERRSLHPVEIHAYKWSDTADKDEYTKCVKSFVKRFHDAGWKVTANPGHVVRACYLASNGLIGLTRDLLRSAEILGRAEKRLDTALLASGFDRLFKTTGLDNPFELEKIDDELLSLWYRRARERADQFDNRVKKGNEK